jgi:hypothetical protein
MNMDEAVTSPRDVYLERLMAVGSVELTTPLNGGRGVLEKFETPPYFADNLK